jgi:hypothetical protein
VMTLGVNVIGEAILRKTQHATAGIH